MKYLIVAVVTWATVASAAFDYETFTQRLRVKKITTVEDALGELPAEFWSYYVLIRDSRSTQGASREYPRVILSGLDGSLLVAFQGDPNLPGHDNLEMIQARDGGRRFEMRQIRFPDARNHLREPQFSDANPRQCLACHRADPRPNWEQYSTWTGAYGERDDSLANPERADYLDFVARHGGEPRYRRLLREGGPIAPYTDSLPDLDTRPNLFFTKLVARWNAKRMVIKLLNGLQGRDRLAPLAVLVECDKLPPSALPRVARVLGVRPAEVPDWLGFGKNGRSRLLTARGIAPSDWSLVFNTQPDEATPRFDGQFHYFDGLFDMRDLVEYALIQTLRGEIPALEPIAGQTGYFPDDTTPPRRLAMMNAVNALGGATQAGTGQVCSLVGQLMAEPVR